MFAPAEAANLHDGPHYEPDYTAGQHNQHVHIPSCDFYAYRDHLADRDANDDSHQGEFWLRRALRAPLP